MSEKMQGFISGACAAVGVCFALLVWSLLSYEAGKASVTDNFNCQAKPIKPSSREIKIE